MIDILLASYNGEKYISEQIESILQQDYNDFRIIIRDDGSSDNTVGIIKEYCKKYPQKIILIEDSIQCKSAQKNFFELLHYAQSEYVMFCDQDDWWLPNKVSICMREMKKLEKNYSKNIPILVYAEYKVVGKNLEDIGFNHKKSQVAKHYHELNRLLVQNYITGCLILMNKSLYLTMGEYNESIPMHDGWAALCASSLGKISHIDDVVMLYRQHGGNCAGALDVTDARYRIRRLFDPNSRNSMHVYIKQAQLLLKRYANQMPEDKKKCLEKFISIEKEKNKVVRILKLIKGNYLKSDIVRKIGQIWFV